MFVVPVIVYLVAGRVARELRDTDVHPWRGGERVAVRRTPDGGFAARDNE